MNISAYILEYLKQSGSVTVPDFGVFSLEKSKAVINSENGSILPPASKIVYAPDYRVQSDDLAAFIAGHKQMTVEASKTDLQIQTDFWKKKLQADQMLEIQGLGTIFTEDGETHFKGNRLQSDHPDFYGLEEIRFSDISNKESQKAIDKPEKDYRFNKSILWVFLVIIPVAGMLYVAFTQQELLFGKKSFDPAKVSVQTTTHRIPDDTLKVKNVIPPVPADSLKKDSLRKDSVLKQNIQPASGHAAKSKTPLYNTKKKWQK